MLCTRVSWKKYIVARKTSVSCFRSNVFDLRKKPLAFFSFVRELTFCRKHVIFKQNRFFAILPKKTVCCSRSFKSVSMSVSGVWWHQKIRHFKLFRLTVVLLIGGRFKCSAGPSKVGPISAFSDKGNAHKKGAVNEQYASSREQKWILHQKVAGNHMLVVANTQRIVENEHVEVARFSSYAQSGTFWVENLWFGQYWMVLCAKLGK